MLASQKKLSGRTQTHPTLRARLSAEVLGARDIPAVVVSLGNVVVDGCQVVVVSETPAGLLVHTNYEEVVIPYGQVAPWSQVMVTGTNASDYIANTSNHQLVAYGRAGDDRIVSTYTGPDYLCGGSGNDYLNGGEGDDILYGDDGDDSLNGWGGQDRLYGGNGNDILLGYDGNDFLYGQGGDDYLWGSNGDDILDGGTGIDTFNGGAGRDKFLGTHDWWFFMQDQFEDFNWYEDWRD